MENKNNATMQQPQTLTIAASELIKEASRIKDFRGDNTYDLMTFIKEVEIILPLFSENPTLQEFIFHRHILTKIQGPALHATRILGPTPNWTQIKEELIRNFGIKETYHNLYHQAIDTKYRNVSDYFHCLKYILDKLNSKYEQDSNKPTEFSPQINESLILKTFLNGIEPHLSSIVYSRNITCLRDAYHLLEETGMIRKYDHRTNRENRFTQNHRYHENRLSSLHSLHNTNSANLVFNDNNNLNSGQVKRNQSRSGQFNRNYQQNAYSQNHFNNRESGQFRQNHFNNRESGQFRQNHYNNKESGQYRQNRPDPMEIDHLQHTYDEEENFQSLRHNTTYR